MIKCSRCSRCGVCLNSAVCAQTALGGVLPVGVVEAGVALRGQSADLLPVGDEFVLLQVDLGGVVGVCLLQALCISTQCVDLRKEKTKGTWLDEVHHFMAVLYGCCH